MPVTRTQLILLGLTFLAIGTYWIAVVGQRL